MNLWDNKCQDSEDISASLYMSLFAGMALGKLFADKKEGEKSQKAGLVADEADNGRLRDNPGRE